MLSTREATIEEDMVYSILGLLGLESFEGIKYGIGFEEARVRVLKALDHEILGSILCTDWYYGLLKLKGGKSTKGVILINLLATNAKFDRNKGLSICSRREKLRLWNSPSVYGRGLSPVIL